MCLVGYAGKNVYNTGKTSALLSGNASEANRRYVVAPTVGEFKWHMHILIYIYLMKAYLLKLGVGDFYW